MSNKEIVLNSTIKRILTDVKKIIKSPLDDNGIYYFHNEENIYNGKALIIGPSDTPYVSGYYFFDLSFPTDYPYSPPKVTFCTQGENVRFNPNLYTNGKVCLSILNTWAGEQWASIHTISSILLTISSILNKNPLLNEPYIKEDNRTEINTYNEIVEYANIYIAYLGMFTKKYLNEDFLHFYPIIEKNFYSNLDTILAICEKKSKENVNRTTIFFKIYNIRIFIDYNKVIEELEKYKK